MLRAGMVLDGLALMRGAFIRLEDYKLETAAQTLLGKRQAVRPARSAAQEIEDAYRHERQSARRLQPRGRARWCSRSSADDAAGRAGRAAQPADRHAARSRRRRHRLDRLRSTCGELRARGRVAPSVHAAAATSAAVAGGCVLDSRPGLYRNILVFDFKSLYPSIIRTFNIDPLTYVARRRPTGPPT